MEAQADRLREHLKAGNRVDPLSSWLDLGIYNFSARISELRGSLPGLKSDWKKVNNRFGETIRVKEYWIEAAA